MSANRELLRDAAVVGYHYERLLIGSLITKPLAIATETAHICLLTAITKEAET